MQRLVRDDPERPDPGFAELYASLPDASGDRLQPWLEWSSRARPPVLYLGVGAGRLAVPLSSAGVRLVGVDAHPGMLEALRRRRTGIELVQARIETLDLGRRYDLVIGPSSILGSEANLAAGARHARRWVGLEVMNPHWLLAGGSPGVRVTATDRRRRAAIEVDYPGGYTQLAEGPLVWPEQIEGWLEAAGLRLVRMSGSALDLDVSPTYFVLATTLPVGDFSLL